MLKGLKGTKKAPKKTAGRMSVLMGIGSYFDVAY